MVVVPVRAPEFGHGHGVGPRNSRAARRERNRAFAACACGLMSRSPARKPGRSQIHIAAEAVLTGHADRTIRAGAADEKCETAGRDERLKLGVVLASAAVASTDPRQAA